VRPQANVVTHLVLDVFLWQLDLLLEDVIDPVELDGLLPVIEGACDEDFIGIVFPVPNGQSARVKEEPSGSATYHLKV
jgi:hypothetical protein